MADIIAQQGAFVTSGSYGRFTWFTQYLNQVAMCSIDFVVDSISSPAPTYGAMALDMLSATYLHFLAPMPDTINFLGVKCLPLGRVPPPLPGIATSTRVGGVIGGSELPGQTSGVISKQTILAGQKFRGRMYHPFPDSTYFDAGSGFPTAAYVTQLNAFAADVLANVAVGGPGVATLRYVVTHKDPVTGLYTSTDIIGMRGRQQFGNQRRRGDYGQSNSPVIS